MFDLLLLCWRLINFSCKNITFDYQYSNVLHKHIFRKSMIYHIY